MTSSSQNSSPANILQPPTFMAVGERRSPHNITVASLCCDAVEANSAFTASTEHHQSYGLKASSTLHVVPTRARRRQLEVTIPLPLSAHSQYPNVFGLANQDAPPSCLDTTKILSGACDVMELACGSVLYRNRVSDHDADLRVHPATQTAHAESPQRIFRPARPSYTDEKRFSIMYYRIVRGLSWPEIEVEFAKFFNLRTKDGLTSIYYRIRKMWAMDKVLDTEINSMSDRSRVESEASRFSSEFLMDLGYFA